jgi:putative hydrolase of the HAD superfamily
MGLEPDPKIVAAGVIAYHEAKRKYLVPFSDARRTLDALRKKGYKLGVVSNGIPVKQWEKLIRLNLQRHFDVVIIATAKHELKPSPKAFLAAAKRLGVRPDEVVFVGDRPEKDIKGANRAGMISVQLISGMDCPELPQGRQQEPDIIIRRLTDLPRAIDSL